MAYLANSDIETFLNITLETQGAAIVTALIPVVSAIADKYTNRTWSKASGDSIVETYDGGESVYFVKTPTIASVTSVVVNDQTLVENTDFWVYDDHIELNGRATDLPKTVVITYKTSATAAPAEVKHALVQWVSQLFKSQSDGGKVVNRVSAGPVSMDFLTAADIPPFVKMVLDLYRLPPTNNN
jgi:hypothetical protein